MNRRKRREGNVDCPRRRANRYTSIFLNTHAEIVLPGFFVSGAAVSLPISAPSPGRCTHTHTVTHTHCSTRSHTHTQMQAPCGGEPSKTQVIRLSCFGISNTLSPTEDESLTPAQSLPLVTRLTTGSLLIGESWLNPRYLNPSNQKPSKKSSCCFVVTLLMAVC